MKTLRKILYSLGILLSLQACNEGIDPISPVEPGVDERAPTIALTSPKEGDQLIIAVGSGLPVMLEVIDDIELASVKFTVNGKEFDKISTFNDYRRYAPVKGHTLKLGDGSYSMLIEGADKAGKSTLSKLVNFSVVEMGNFKPVYGESFYMSFQKHFLDHASVKKAKVTGSPFFVENGVKGSAYQGVDKANLSFPVTDVFKGKEISVAFWYNIAQQGRSGILSASPSGSNNNRVAGFRLFREGGDDAQTIKLNVGNGSYDQWFDGGAAATVNPQTTDWVHVAFTISQSSAAVYINGELAVKSDMAEPISWDKCDDLYIASSGPHFSEWGHGDDLSQYDELRIFNKVLSQDEIKAIILAEEKN